MDINIMRIIFTCMAASCGVAGLLLNYLEPYLPVLITRTYRYGKYATNKEHQLVAKVEVPKRWYRHFYIFAAPATTYILYLVICKYFCNGNIPLNVLWASDVLIGASRKALVSAESTFLASVLLTLHCWKRLYETCAISVFSDKKMNISHYLVGLFHYAGVSICIIAESKGFVKGSQGIFSWARITIPQLICAAIFLWSSYVQLKANIILRNLRKTDDGVIIPSGYRIPHGGLFEYVSGALQSTEILIYLMISILLWHSTTFHYITLWVIVNQVECAFLTHWWYQQTFPNYPRTRKVLIPFVL